MKIIVGVKEKRMHVQEEEDEEKKTRTVLDCHITTSMKMKRIEKIRSLDAAIHEIVQIFFFSLFSFSLVNCFVFSFPHNIFKYLPKHFD